MRAPDTGSAIVGRSAELEAFQPFLDAVAKGRAALVFEGDAGIGKTTLWTAATEMAREQGYTILSCRPAEAEMQLPFSALGDLLDQVDRDTLATLPDPQRHALDVAMLRVDSSSSTIERRAVSLAVVGVMRALAVEMPLVVAVDDVQWLDAPSSAALQYALRRLTSERVGLLATRRRQGAMVMDSFAELFSGDRLQRLELGPLDRDALRRLLVDRLNLPLSHPALLQLHRVSAGSPFLALEIARALERREIEPVPGEPFPVPHDLRQLVRDRLDRLSVAARETGLVVAALAQPTVERVEASGEVLGELLDAGIVELDGQRVRFTHPLLASIVYSEVSPGRRRELHARLASVMTDVDERARHLALGAAGPDAGIAAALDEAALRARRRGAPETAAELLEQAVQLTPEDDISPRHRRTMNAAERHFEAGATARARDLFEIVAKDAPDRDVRLHAGARLGQTRVLTGDIGGAEDAFRRARREAGDASRMPSGIEDGLSLVCEFRGDIQGAARHARAAVKLAERNNERVELVQALARTALFEARLGRRTTWGRMRRALALSREIEDLPVIAHPGWIHAQLLGGGGELNAACAILRALRERALDEGDEGSLGVVLTSLCECEIRAGRLDAAAAAATEGNLSTLGTGQVAQRIFMLKGVVLVDALRGRVATARAVAAEARELIAQTDFDPLLANMDMALGMLDLSLGDPAAADRTLAPLNELVPAGPVRETGWFRFLADHLEALLALGKLDVARETVAKIDGRRHTLLDQTWTAQASLRCRGLFDVAGGETAAGLDALERAVDLSVRGEEPFELARNLLALGRAQRRLKQRGAARASLWRAVALFEQLGTPLWCERAQEELGRIGGRPRRAPGLTETEQRVAELAAQGLTNREIAAAAFLTVNTVQAYLKRIYRELGIRSRTELARDFTPSRSSKSTDSGVSGSSLRT